MLTRKAITLKRIVLGKPEWQESITGSCEYCMVSALGLMRVHVMPVKYRDYFQFA